MKTYKLVMNSMQKEILEHAIRFCIDSQNEMGAITPNIASDLEAILINIKVEKRGGIYEV